MIHVLIATRGGGGRDKKGGVGEDSEKDSVAMVKNLFKISPNADKTLFLSAHSTLPASPQPPRLLTSFRDASLMLLDDLFHENRVIDKEGPWGLCNDPS